ncbi:putative RNA-directed DNA polymerase [Tanacetum coccineum]
MEEVANKVSLFMFSEVNDRWTWSLDGEGLFTVSSARRYINDGLCLLDGSRTRWIKLVPSELIVGFETTHHVFYSCSVASAIVTRILMWRRLLAIGFATYQDWLSWLEGLKIRREVNVYLKGTENYKVWSAAVQLALHTRNKIGFINEKCIREENASPLQDQWDRCNAVVLSWLLGSVSQDVYKGQIFSKNSKVLWDELKETYNKQDGSMIFNLHHKIYTLSQSGMSLSEYYHECNALWRQFNALIDLPDCTCAAAQKVKDHGQLLRLMQFLMGLDDMYNSVRSLILTTEPLPDLRSAFATLSRDESHRNSGSSSKSVKTGPTAFVSRPSNGNNWNTNKTGNNNNNNFGSNRRFGRMSNLVCKHCNMTGHTIDRCFELLGYPSGFKRNNFGQSNTNNATNNDIKAYQSKSVPNTLTNDQYQRLMALLSDTGTTSKTHASIAGTFKINNTVISFYACKFFNINSNISTYSTYIGWIINSGASQHITFCSNFLYDIIDVTGLNLNVSHPNGTVEHVKCIGSYKLANDLIIKDMLVDLGIMFLMGTGSEKEGLYFLDEGKRVNNSNIKSCQVSTNIWHNRLGHPSDQVLIVLKNKLKYLNHIEPDPCEVCHKAKQTREPFPLSVHKTKRLGDLVHLDVWGPYRVISREGFKYFLIVVDDFTRAVWVFLMQSKTENGETERHHRHLLNTARALMFQGGLPLNMWPEYVLTATYLINRLPTAVLSGKSPYECVYKTEPNLLHLKTFCYLCFLTVLNKSDKFGSRADKCVFVGYDFNKKGYKLYNLDQKKFIFSRDVKFYETVFPFKNNSFTKEYVFEENGINDLNFINETNDNSLRSNDPYDDGGDSADNGNKSAPKGSVNSPNDNTIDDAAKDQSHVQTESTYTIDLSGSSPNRKVNQDNQYATEIEVSEGIQNTTDNDDNYESEGEDLEGFGQLFESSDQQAVGQNLRRSSRKSTLPSKLKDYELNKNVKYSINKVINYSHLSIDNLVFTTSLNKIHEPSTYAEAIKDSRSVKAMNQEIEALNRNNTWRFKARLVNQREGIDYEETFSPVVKIVTIRCILTIAVNNKWPLFQLDINNAFLYGELEEDVYMSIPEGYSDQGDKRVCKLVKSLYGLKQAPSKWNEKLTSLLIENGFKQSLNDFSLFVKNDKDVMLILLVYVDDIIVTGNNVDEINKFKQFLGSKFLIKDLGKLKYFLGIKVLDIDNGICLTQRNYFTELLNEFGMLAFKPCSTPIEVNLDDKKVVAKYGDDVPLTGITNYQNLIGKLIYLTMTRPDISYVVHCLSQVMHKPMQSHLRLAFRVLRYLKKEPGLGITFRESDNSDLRVFVDSDWAKCKITKRSITGYSVFLVLWIRKVLADLQVNISLPVEMSCDNSTAIQIAENPVLHERSKHFEIDLFTKGLTISKHNKFCQALGLFNVFHV